MWPEGTEQVAAQVPRLLCPPLCAATPASLSFEALIYDLAALGTGSCPHRAAVLQVVHRFPLPRTPFHPTKQPNPRTEGQPRLRPEKL